MSTIPADAPVWRIEFDRVARFKALAVTLAFCAVFFYVIRDLMYEWQNSSDWSHGWLIPVFSAYLIHGRWEKIQKLPITHTWVGLALMIVSLLVYQYSLWGLIIGYLRPLAMLTCLLGVAIYLCGLPMLRQAFVPWVYLFFAVPLPKAVYFTLTDPLRRMAAIVATSCLASVPGLDIERVGSNISYFYKGVQGNIGVADACSGMRALITLCALGVAVTFISERPAWQRVIMLLACLPIAVFSNFVRVTVTCVLHIFVDPRYAEGSAHWMLGIVTLSIALGMFLGLIWVMERLVVDDAVDADEDDDADHSPAKAGA